MRFYKPGQTQYQSQFAPLDLNFIQKIGAAKDAESYGVDDMLDKADQLQIDAGMFSKKDEVDKYNQWLKSNVATTRDKLLNQEITEQEAARNISKINSVLANSDAVKFFNTDRELSKQIRANMAAGKYNQGISTNFNYLDPNNPQITQMSYTEGLDALARAGNIQTPTGIYDKENYQHQMDKFVADATSKQWDSAPKEYDKLTGIPMIKIGNHKYTKEELQESKVREWARNAWEQENRNTNTPFMQYQKKLFGLQGEEYTQKQFEDDAAKAYSGYYKKEINQDDYNYSQINNSSKKTIPDTPGTAYPAAGTPTKRGVENTANFKNQITNFFSNTINEPQYSKNGNIIGYKQTPYDFKTENLSEGSKKLMSHYFKLKANQTGNQYFQRLSEDILKGKSIDFLKSDTYYDKIKNSGFTKEGFINEITSPEFLSRMEQVDVRNNNVVEDLPYDSEEFYKEAGIRNSATSPANLEDFLASALATQSKIYDIEEGKVIEPGKIKEEYKDLSSSERASTRVGITRYRPENNFAVSIGDGDDWANTYQVNIGGKPYAVQAGRHQDPLKKQKEYDYKMINKIHNTLTLGMPGEVLHWGNGDFIYDDSDKKNPVYVEIKTGQVLHSPTEVYIWGDKNR